MNRPSDQVEKNDDRDSSGQHGGAGDWSRLRDAGLGAGFRRQLDQGTWALAVEGFVAEGLINGAFDPGTPLFAIGRVIFDGEGGCESDDQLVVGNVAIPANPGDQRTATACSYQVQPNGYGFFEVTFDNPQGGDDTTTTARFVIEAKKKISLIADNAELGIFGGGTLIRQSRSIR